MKKLIISLIFISAISFGTMVRAAESFDTPQDTGLSNTVKSQKVKKLEDSKKYKSKKEKKQRKFFSRAEKANTQKNQEESASPSEIPNNDILEDETTNTEIQNDEKKQKHVQKTIKKSKQTQKVEEPQEPTENILVDSDTIEYFPERAEFEALGNAKVTFPEQHSQLNADKIIFNHDTNYIKAYDNVVLVRDGEKVYGDYMHINLNDENALIKNPDLRRMNIRIKAKTGNVYEAKTEALDGTANFIDKGMFKFISRSVFGLEEPVIEDSFKKEYFLKEKYDNKWTIKCNKIVIDSSKDRDVATIYNADMYLKDKKVARTGKIKVFTDKKQSYVETNMIELGAMRNLGSYVAPSYVFQTPFGTTLKLGPALTLGGDLGFGAIGRFMSESNRTEFGYGSSKSKFVLRGRQDLTEHTYLEYGINSYINEWFQGGRMPQHSIQLINQREYVLKDLADTRFENRFSVGYAKDWNRDFSTMRARWQTQTSKDVFEYKNEEKQFGFKLGAAVQSTATLYGTGDTYGMIRVGPTLKTQYKNWQQYIAYYQGAEAGNSPMLFDRFYYGKSSLMLGESLRVNKYLTLMYSGVIALASTPNNKMLQENRFWVALGPDDFKILLGYDAYRQSTVFGVDMAIGTDNSDVEFKRLILNEPSNLGSPKKESKKRKMQQAAEKKKQEEAKNVDPMNRSVRDYEDYNPDFNMMNGAIIQPTMIRPPGY